MTLNELIKSTITGQLVDFSKGHSKTGFVIIVTSQQDNKKYIIEKSIKDFSRFEDWIDKEARADIRQTGKYYKIEEGKFPLIQIRVKVEDQNQDMKNKEIVF